MTSINKLTQNKSANADDLIPIWDSENKRTRSLSVKTIVEYIEPETEKFVASGVYSGGTLTLTYNDETTITIPGFSFKSTELTDMPSELTAGKVLQVKEDGAGYELVDPSGVGTDLLYHDTVNNRLVSTIPLQTTLASVFLKDALSLSSSGTDLAIRKIDNDDYSYPVVSTLHDHQLPINRTPVGVQRASANDFGDVVDDGSGGFEPRGGPAVSGAVDFTLNTTLTQSLSIFEILVIAEEPIEPTDTLFYGIYRGASSSGRQVYEQELTNITVAQGGDFNWDFQGNSNLLSGEQLHVEMLIDKGTTGEGIRPLLVRPSASQPTEIYAKLFARAYSIKEIAYKDEVDAIINGAEYKGAWDAANNPNQLDGLTPSLGDTYRVSVAGTHDLGFGSTDFEVGDFVVWNGAGWDYFPLNSATIGEIESSALSQYDITVDANYHGSISTGSSLRPFKTVSEGIAAAVDGSTILVKGQHFITSELTLPNSKSLHFYGQNGAVVGYETYTTTNGNIFYGDALNNTKKYTFQNLIIKNAGGYGIQIKNALQVNLIDNQYHYNGWDGTQLNTVLPSSSSGLLGFDSTQSELQAFYASSSASNGGAVRLENVTQVNAISNDGTHNLRGLRFEDCGVNGYGFVTRNVMTQNIDSGIYLASSTYNAANGCENFTVFNNASKFNANNGVLCVGGLNNVISLNAIQGNWNAGVMGWHCSNTRFRNLDLSDNNRSAFNGIGNNGDAYASVTIGGNTARAGRDYIADILSVEVYNTGLGSNTSKIGLQILQDVEQITDNYDKSLINIDNSGFVNQDYSIDALCDGDIVKITLGDNRYIGTVERNLSISTGHYYELPYSNHITNLKECDISIEGDSVILREGIGGVRLNPYTIYDLRAELNGTDIKIVLRDSEKIQFNAAISGVSIDGALLTGTNQEKVNEINALIQNAGSSSGQPPQITSPLAVTLQEGTTLNYELTADFAIAYEWDLSSVQSEITTVNGNIRKLIGGSNLAVGTYNIPVKAFNYDNNVGVDSETLVLTVSAPPFSNTKSINFANSDYLGANASLLNATLGRSGNGGGSGDAWTISLWFKPSTNSSGQTIFYFGDNDVANAGHINLRFIGGSDSLRLQYGSNNNYLRFQTAGSSLTPGQWHHIMVSYDGGTTGASSGSMSSYYGRFDVFIDGASVVSLGTWSHNNFGYSGGIDPDNLRVGRYASGNYMKGCRVDELAIWNSDQSANISTIYDSGNVKDLDTLTTKPKHWWRMGDGDNYPNIIDHGTEANCVFVMYNMTAADIVSDVP